MATFLHPFVTRSHRGVYGIIRQGNRILVIRKTRGPYTGLYDLPGGSPEPGETPEQTLAREIQEETGCTLATYQNKQERTIFFSQFTKASGEVGCLQHTGVLFNACVKGIPTMQGDGLDSGGAVWMEVDQLSSQNATPFVLMGFGREVISLANKAGKPMDAIVRGEPLPPERYPMIAGVFLMRSDGRIVLQRVARHKRVDAGKWSYSAAGHVAAGETCQVAALRELREEMGVEASDAVFAAEAFATFPDGRLRAFHQVFQVVSDAPITFDPAEVDEVRIGTIQEIKTLIQAHPDRVKEVFGKLFNATFKEKGE